MARWKSNNPKSGRTAPVPKAGTAGKAGEDHGSGRYTPPTVRPEDLPGAAWVPIVMAVCFGLGVLVIIVNYLGWWPGAPSNNYLGVGLLFVLAGTIAATRWR